MLQALLLRPLIWALVAFVVAVFFLRRRDERRAMRALLVGLVVLLVSSLPIVANLLRRPLERAYPTLPVAAYPTADAIVVLGGSAVGRIAPRAEAEEPGGARLQMAARLYRAGKSKWIVVSGGVPYRDVTERERTEADDMTEVLEQLGVPVAAVLREDRSGTTRENARFTAAILRERSLSTVLLVTSAFHMRRAAANFRREGVSLTPVPTALEAVDGAWYGGLWPDAGALVSTTVSIKEYVGALF